MNIKLLSIALLICGISYGQIGIGTDLPDQSAMLHVSASNKGVLVPEVSLTTLTDTSMISGENPAEGLIVYNKSNNDDLKKGFYYWGINPEDDTKKQWVKVIGSLDMLSYVKENQSKGSLVVTPLEEGVSTQSFEFKSDENSTEEGVKFNETLTALVTENKFLAKYDKLGESGEVIEHRYIEVDDIGGHGTLEEQTAMQNEEFYYVETFVETSFKYVDEKGSAYVHKMTDIVGKAETLTTLYFISDYKTPNNIVIPALVYSAEDGKEQIIDLSRLLETSETVTSLSVANNLSGLEYIDETKIPRIIDITPLIKTPWGKAKSTALDGMPINGDNIYTQGWVGIGFDQPSGEPEEKLRVNGSITAVNSYYADYVFESYFKGHSALKYDYKFNDLKTVESFIKTNNHLPGITPISHLEKSEEGYAFNVSELSIQLLEKTEELYLHIIEQAKEIEQLKQVNAELDILKKENQDLKSQLNRIEHLLNEKSVK